MVLMKRRRREQAFFDELMKATRSLGKMKPNEVHVLSVNANYGRYEIIIGPQSRESSEGGYSRHPIEINGQIHHLFISSHKLRALPSKNQILRNLKDTVIVRDLSVHFRDPWGDGHHLDKSNGGDNGIQFREYINLAGNEGEDLIHEAEHSDRLSLEAYRIIQKDILHALKERRGRAHKALH
jgi:hypothetical protein